MITWPLYLAPATIPLTSQYSAVEQTRRDFLLRTATGADLTTIGQNYGVPRPWLVSSDAIYARCVQVLAWQPKMILFTTEALLTAVFGSQTEIVAAGGRAWQVYEVRANEIIVEVPSALLNITQENASYYHGWNGYALNASGLSSDTFTTEGDVRTSSAVSLVGKSLYLYVGGVWSAYTISAISYSKATNTTTIQINTSAVPVGGAFFHVLPSSADSFSGDYVAPSGFVDVFFTQAGVGTTTTINVWGDRAGELYDDGALRLIYNGQIYATTIQNPPVYTPPAVPPSLGDYTAVVINTPVPMGLTNGLVLRAIERADVATAVIHDDRLYFTDRGLYAIFDYYYTSLVKASGVLLRFEQI